LNLELLTLSMVIDRFKHEELGGFLALAATEDWICGRWEFDFLLGSFPQGCLAMRMDDVPVAFITAIKYGTSGWIGNLVVRKDLRGQGIGSALMGKALDALLEAGARTVWLTASEAGRSIYERLGFDAIDAVRRWYGSGISGEGGEATDYARTDLLALDRAGWGDYREAIIAEALAHGKVTASDSGFLISQAGAEGVQLGPWGADGPETAGALLDIARALAGEGTRLFLDVPAHNDDAAPLLLSRGFSERGSALLMFLGEKPAYEPGRIYSLASMGSMG
jgi:GNAT superfamily N-acetyltransferase